MIFLWQLTYFLLLQYQLIKKNFLRILCWIKRKMVRVSPKIPQWARNFLLIMKNKCTWHLTLWTCEQKKSAKILWGRYSLLNFFSSIWAFNDPEGNHSNFTMSTSAAKPTNCLMYKRWFLNLHIVCEIELSCIK